MTPEFLSQAADAVARARTVLAEVTSDLEATAEKHEEAKASLQNAISSHLLDRTDPTLRDRLQDAEKAERAARDALEHAALYRSAARQNLANAEEAYQAAVRRDASDIIQRRSVELLTLSKEADATLNRFVELLKKGHEVETSIAVAAKSGLGFNDVIDWREATASRANAVISAAQSGKSHGYGPVAYSAALHDALYSQSWPGYAPSQPDPDYAAI